MHCTVLSNFDLNGLFLGMGHEWGDSEKLMRVHLAPGLWREKIIWSHCRKLRRRKTWCLLTPCLGFQKLLKVSTMMTRTVETGLSKQQDKNIQTINKTEAADLTNHEKWVFNLNCLKIKLIVFLLNLKILNKPPGCRGETSCLQRPQWRGPCELDVESYWGTTSRYAARTWPSL